MTIKLLVGLRNPGATYEHTRHNAGGWFVAALAKQSGAVFKPALSGQANCARMETNNHAYTALLPLTFMNLSGAPVRAACQFYKLAPEEVLVAHDDLDLPPGRITFKTGGGHGGHNGLRDIITQLGSSAFHRVRIGIGHPGHKDLVVNYVLGKPSVSDRDLIESAIARGLFVLPTALSGNMATTMQLLQQQTEENHGV